MYNCILFIGALIGFTNLGDITSHLAEFERSLESDRFPTNSIANSMLVLMVRGLFSQLKFPYAQFPSTSLCGHEMYEVVWDTVGRLECCGFKVLALTCDGLAANRRLFALHHPDNCEFVYKVVNPYASDGRYLYFLSDPPHLIKTVRNAWCNSSRNLWVS